MNKLLSTENITKKFGGVYAANSISVDIDELLSSWFNWQ